MKITSACIYALNIPFVASFKHSLCERDHSDSIVVKMTTESGIAGFGEGVPRPYVTGETREACIEHIRNDELPRIMGAELGSLDPMRAFTDGNHLLPDQPVAGGIAWNASRCAVELALLDCLLRKHDLSVNEVLPPVVQTVTYSGVISAGSTAGIEKMARRCKAAGLKHVKMKVCSNEDVTRVAAVRDILGPSVSIRLDANAAFNPETAIRFLKLVEGYDIACIEQPIPRGDPAELAALRSSSPVPVMADESIVTIQDATELIAENAADYFNLRISKCGGIRNTLAIAERAASAGIGFQLGCQVGETAILSAAGRGLAAHLQDLRFVEGSYGTHLLVEDIAEEDITFGPEGKAPVLTGAGLGITIREGRLDRYAEDTIHVGRE